MAEQAVIGEPKAPPGPATEATFAPGGPGGLERLELHVARLQVTFRFTLAFHAREVRFERNLGEGFERIFPETFSFHADRHDPTELFLTLDDLLRKPRLLSPLAHRRDSEELVSRLLAEVPRYLDRVVAALESAGRVAGEARVRLHQDVAMLSTVLMRFTDTRGLAERRSVRVGHWVMQRRIYRSLRVLLDERVEPDYLEAYARGEVDPVDPADDPSESGVFHAMESDDPEVRNRILVRMAERAFYLWLEGVCLDPDNQAFEKEDSPFRDRETEVLDAITVSSERLRVQRGEDLVAFLRRPTRDCQRALSKLEGWFLRRYDIPHSSALIQHAAWVGARRDDPKRVLSRHSTGNYVMLLAFLVAPFAGAVFAYDRAPRLFDALCTAEVLLVNAFALWFLGYRFLVKQDLTLFHASVPRILAGVIVGYLPVFLIDEVWDLAERSHYTLLSIGFVLGITTLLYIYVEVQRRLGSVPAAFSRARSIFLLGIVEAVGVGMMMTSLVGPFMVRRNWSPGEEALPMAALRVELEPILGQLPPIVGFEPFYIFPSAVFTMTFLSFFIGIFLQLMWEDLPITEPL